MSAERYAEPFPRRHPLSNNLNNYRQQAPPSIPKSQLDPVKPVASAPKPARSPPLPRQNAKVTPPSPPRVIVDVNHHAEYELVGLLGEVRRVFLESGSRVDMTYRRVALRVCTRSRTAMALSVLARSSQPPPSKRRRQRQKYVIIHLMNLNPPILLLVISYLRSPLFRRVFSFSAANLVGPGCW